MKILIIDDSIGVAEALKQLLEYHNHKCHTINNGTDGLKLILTGSFDAVILDSHITGLDSLDIVNQLKKDKITISNIIILALSADRQQQFRDLGIKHFILKPASVEEICMAIDNIRVQLLMEHA